MAYAETTTVPFDRSISECFEILRKASAPRDGTKALFYAKGNPSAIIKIHGVRAALAGSALYPPAAPTHPTTGARQWITRMNKK